jgi:sugar phosphate isomerase/epimerase
MTIACSTAVRCNSSLERALADIAGAGFRSIDLLTIDGWAHVNTSDLAERWQPTLERLDGLLRQHHLTPIALNTGVSAQLHQRSEAINDRRRHEIDALIRLMQRYNIGIAAIQPRNNDPERPWEELLRDCAATLREQFAAAEAAGVVFALELHVGSPFETLGQARRLIELIPDLPLVYDPTHFVMQGVPIDQTGWLLDHARHLHLRDAAPGKLQVPFGMGAVDFDWLLGSLRERGYQGHISIEYLETDEFDALDSARRLYDLVATYFPE